MSVPERIDFLQLLWNAVSADSDEVPDPAWHKWVLDQRTKIAGGSNALARSWPPVRREIERELRRRR
jgi:hypothetical protein